MNCLYGQVLALCGELAGFAEQLEARRRDAAWYLAVEPLCDALEFHMQDPAPALVERLFADPQLLRLVPSLYRFRAAFEFDREMARAREILGSAKPAACLKAYVRQESHWSLPSALAAQLGACRSVIVAGSGPLPLTAFAVASAFGVRVTMLECDSEALALATRLVAVAELHDAVDGLHGDIAALEDLGSYDAVFAAALLGVGMHADPAHAKSRLLTQVLARMRCGTPLILREPHGLGRLLYPPAEFGDCDAFAACRHAPDSGLDMPYRSGLLVVRRLQPSGAHADASTLPIHP